MRSGVSELCDCIIIEIIDISGVILGAYSTRTYDHAGVEKSYGTRESYVRILRSNLFFFPPVLFLGHNVTLRVFFRDFLAPFSDDVAASNNAQTLRKKYPYATYREISCNGETRGARSAKSRLAIPTPA